VWLVEGTFPVCLSFQYYLAYIRPKGHKRTNEQRLERRLGEARVDIACEVKRLLLHVTCFAGKQKLPYEVKLAVNLASGSQPQVATPIRVAVCLT
jgi:hypothetical protein